MKLLALQLIVTILGISSLVAEMKDDPNQPTKRWKKVRRVCGIIALLFGGAILIIGNQNAAQKGLEARQELEHQIERHKEQLLLSKQIQDAQKEQISQADQLAQRQKEVIDDQKRALELSAMLLNTQNRGLHQLSRIGLDRMLTGIEVSYKPTAQEWKAIVDLYRKIVPTNGESSYYDSPIIATRAGAYWRIDFEEISLKEGRKWFSPVFTDDSRNRGFEEIIQRASLPLWIKWGTGAQTFLEPMRGDFPSGIRLSPDMFSFTLRPPLLELNLDSLHANSLITLRSRKRLPELTFHSLDPAVKLEQTLQLGWTRSTPNTPQGINSISIKERLHPYVSGPHRLKLSFTTLKR